MKSSSGNEPAGSGPPPQPLSRTLTASFRASGPVVARILCVLLFSSAVAAQSLPYIPTSIFLPVPRAGQTQDNATADIAYVFSPRDDSVDLLALDVSSSLSTSSLSLQTLSSGLPFLSGSNTAFVPSLADNGSLIVYAGDCSLSTNPEIWTFSPSVDNAASSAWTRQSATIATDGDTIQMGPGFLGASLSFSTTLEPQVSKAKTFVYGGMCPENGANATTSQWQATYSNQMVKIAPSDSDASGYVVDPVPSKGPPVPEAGFTFTGLSPSMSNRSGTVTQQVNYVLLGGHTANAFINMSTAAIWSLPEESWGFVSDIGMAGSSANANTELAVKNAIADIDSRSGHTAVLNEDGTALVIFGGWVGDLTQAALPQLAILEIGTGYGGDGEWQWSVPDCQPEGTGIYGHGATLLPGNVMLIYGGYNIPQDVGNTRRERSTISDTAMFLNLTSMTWTDDYINPYYSENGGSASNNVSASEETKRRLGLGLGIGLGVLAAIAAIPIYFFYRRRLRNKRTIRDSTIRALAQDNSRFLPPDDDDDQGWYGGDPYMTGGRGLGYQSLQGERASMDNSRQHWFGDMPPMPPMQQIARKPVAPRAARGQYQPMPAGPYDSPTSVRSPGGMGPIYEADEEDGGLRDGDIASEPISPVREARNDGYFSDPFSTPTSERPISFPPPSRAPRTPSPGGRRGSATDPDVQDWMSDVDAADALLSGLAAAPRATTTGRGSPTRRASTKSTHRPVGGLATEDDASRTESNVSESNRSNLPPSRAGSDGEHLRAGAAAEERGGSSSSSVPSYNTAKSSFTALQAEGPALLLGRIRERERRGTYNEEDNEYPDLPGSPSKSKPRRSWFGSLRRVFSGATPSPSSSRGDGDPFRDNDDAVAEASDYDARLGGLGSLAADGLLRRKGGRGAWEEATTRSNAAGAGAGQASGAGGQHARKSGDSDEWDIEKAVEQRLVQVLFTVPKERLRVVNAEPEMETGESAVVVDPDSDDDDDDDDNREKGKGKGKERSSSLGAPLSFLMPSPLEAGDDGEEAGAEVEDPEKEALRRELDEEWARAGAEVGADQQSLLDREIEALGRELELDNERSRRKRDNDAAVAAAISAITTDPPPPPPPQPPPQGLGVATTTTTTATTTTPTPTPTPATPLRPSASIPVLTPTRARTPTTPADRSPGDDEVAGSEKPKQPRNRRSTRVLAIVEDIESKSRENSPARSPARGTPPPAGRS